MRQFDLYGKRMVGKPSLFSKDLRRRIYDPFLLAISLAHFCEPNWFPGHSFKDGKQKSLEETRFHEKRYSQVKCNLEKAKSYYVACTWSSKTKLLTQHLYKNIQY